MDSFLEELYAAKVQQGEEDKKVRPNSKNQGFRVNNYYNVLMEGVKNYFLGDLFGVLELHLMLLSLFSWQ